MGLFGENLQPDNFSSKDPLGPGIGQAPDEGAANPGQPVGDGMAAGVVGNGEGENIQKAGQEQGNVFGEQNQQQPPVEEEKIESIDVNDDYERKVAFVRQKFKSSDDFARSIEELQKRLGRENENVQLNSAEEAINYYITLEKELGRTSNIDETRLENQRLKQELQGLRNAVNQLMMQGQLFYNPQTQQITPMRDPLTGRFVSPNQQQPQGQAQTGQGQQTNNLDISFDDIDPDEFMKEFYAKGPNAESFKKVILKAAEKIAEHKVNEALQKTQEEQLTKQQEQFQKQQQAQALKANYDQQVERIKQQYGEQEFERYKNQMTQIFRQYPMYLNPTLFPNGFEIVFNEARQMANNYQQQQNFLNNQQQFNTAQKMAARMNGSRPGQKFNSSRQLSQEEIEKMQIFGQENRAGIFG